jgi:hypothetical protein
MSESTCESRGKSVTLKNTSTISWNAIPYSLVYSVYCVNEGALSSVSDVERYVIIKKLPDSIFNPFPLFICRWEIREYLTWDLLSVMLPTLVMTCAGS